MVFDWFNRFGKKKEKEQDEPVPVPEPTVPDQVEPQQVAQPDYLNWAKQAYTNIQSQESTLEALAREERDEGSAPSIAETPAVSDWQRLLYGESAPTPEPPVTAPPPAPEPLKFEALPPPVVEPVAEVLPPQPLIEPVAEVLPPQPVIEPPTPQPQTPPAAPVTPTPAPEPEMPFWQRLLYGERAKTAPAPEASTAVPPIPEPVQPEVAPIPEPLKFEAPLPPVIEPVAEILPPQPLIEPVAEVLPPQPAIEPPAPQPQMPPAAPVTPTPTPEPEIPFWQRLLYGERAKPAPLPEVPPAPPAVPEPVQPEAPPDAAEPLAQTPPPPAETPIWQRFFPGRSSPATPPEAPQPLPADSPTPEPVDVQFDAGFLWSAEVLAAQGRRPEDVSVEEITWLKKLRDSLGRSRRGLVNNLKAVVGRGPLGPAELEELEGLLLQSDVGVTVSEQILQALQERVRKEALPADRVLPFLKGQLRKRLELDGDDPSRFAPTHGTLNVWLIVGVNGVGKTTTIGKLAHLASRSGYRTMVAAGDTFRAGAVQQLRIWAERAGAAVIANPSPNASPAAVVFDAVAAARAQGIELLLIDTAGRLQNKKNLMDELAKIRGVIDKKAPDARIESLLVLDATTGQNGLRQAEVFADIAKLSGVVLTKLDGTAKGGIAIAIVDQLQLPIRFIGVGEKVNDLRPFNAYEFIEALLSDYD
ncbi:MAG: signal recognition particle-docking protein FtsY [Gemmatimonadaceae bacterium]|nr:signal recognition particle-docking protein FtsY [Gloeobacterales cyanobacterium ES-bin-141]